MFVCLCELSSCLSPRFNQRRAIVGYFPPAQVAFSPPKQAAQWAQPARPPDTARQHSDRPPPLVGCQDAPSGRLIDESIDRSINRLHWWAQFKMQLLSRRWRRSTLSAHFVCLSAALKQNKGLQTGGVFSSTESAVAAPPRLPVSSSPLSPPPWPSQPATPPK